MMLFLLEAQYYPWHANIMVNIRYFDILTRWWQYMENPIYPGRSVIECTNPSIQHFWDMSRRTTCKCTDGDRGKVRGLLKSFWLIFLEAWMPVPNVVPIYSLNIEMILRVSKNTDLLVALEDKSDVKQSQSFFYFFFIVTCKLKALHTHNSCFQLAMVIGSLVRFKLGGVVQSGTYGISPSSMNQHEW